MKISEFVWEIYGIDTETGSFDQSNDLKRMKQAICSILIDKTF